MHMKKTTQKVKHLQYEPPQKYPEATSGAPEGKACPAPSTTPVTLQVRKFQAKINKVALGCCLLFGRVASLTQLIQAYHQYGVGSHPAL